MDHAKTLKLQCVAVFAIFVGMNTALAGAGNITMFLCHEDICNAGTTNQFCSQVFHKCRDCDEVIDDCLTTKLPANCTITCVEYLLEKEKGKPCPLLGIVDHGTHNGTNLRETTGYPATVVSYQCDAGFRLIGTKEIKCAEYGKWSNDPPACEEITCVPLKDVVNGMHNGSRGTSYKPGEHVVTHCKQGYQLAGDITTTCGPDGQWSTALPTCSEITCVPFPPVVNGEWIPAPRSVLKHGQNMTGRCTDGFIVQGSVNWRCTEFGWESVDQEPIMMNCIEPCNCTVYIVIAIVVGVVDIVLVVGIAAIFYCKIRNSNFPMDNPDRQSLLDKTVQDKDITIDLEGDRANYHILKEIASQNTVSLDKSKNFLKKHEPALPTVHTVNPKQLKIENPEASTVDSNGILKDDSKLSLNVTVNIDSRSTNNNDNHNTNQSESSSGDVRTVNDSSTHTPCKPETTANPSNPVNDKYSVEEVNCAGHEQPGANVTQPSQDLESADADQAQTDCKTLSSGQDTARQSESVHRADVYQGFVRAQGNNEQDVNLKLALNNDEVPMGDVNGDTTAPNGILPKPHVVPSSAS